MPGYEQQRIMPSSTQVTANIDRSLGPILSDKPVSEALSMMTGRPAEDFEAAADDLEYPHPDDLESVDHD